MVRPLRLILPICVAACVGEPPIPPRCVGLEPVAVNPRKFLATLPGDAVEVPEHYREEQTQVRMRLVGEATVRGIPCTGDVVFDLPRLNDDTRVSCTLAYDACISGYPLSGGREVRWYVGAGALWMGTLSRPAAVHGVRCEAGRFGAEVGGYDAWCRVAQDTRIDGIVCDGIARFDAGGHLNECQVSGPPSRAKRWYHAPAR